MLQKVSMLRSGRMTLVALAMGCGICITAVASGIPTATDPARDAKSADAGFLRVAETPGRSIALEIASRRFVSDDPAHPMISLVSVAHIADKAFYAAIADLLSQHDIVLYEAVAPAAVRTGGGETTEEKIHDAQRGLTLAASLIEKYKSHHGQYPADLHVLRTFVATLEPIVQNWFIHALTDPWGRQISYERVDEEPGFLLSSAGPPDREDERIQFEDHGSVHPLARDDDNLQKQLAHALGLAYQLHALPYESSNWHISDMTAEDLFSAFRGTEVDFEMFGGTLAGTSLPARMVNMFLRFVRMLDAAYGGAISDMIKVLLIEVLGDEEMVQASITQLNPEFGRILIDQRNQVVIDDVERWIEKRPDIESIAILYGAAHMADLAERLEQQLGYQEQDSLWLRGIEVDLAESKIDQRQLQQMRGLVQRTLRSSSMRRR